MKLSVGIDIVDIVDFRKRIARTKFLKGRIFTKHEREYCENKGLEHLAVRFAAKEAFAKACGVTGLAWHDVEVNNLVSGKPVLSVNEKVMKRLKIRNIDISMSHTRKSAIAFVVVQG